MLESLNIARDCWWAMPSGTSYIIDETGEASKDSHGLYKSLNASDSEYIEKSNGLEFTYYGRLESHNVDTTAIFATMRAESVPAGSAVLSINSMEIGTLNFETISTQTLNFELTDAQKERIHSGRVDGNYDYFDIKVGSHEGVDNTMPTPYLWLKADTKVYTDIAKTTTPNDGDKVASWEDAYGRGIEWTQSDTNYQPIYKTNIINGEPVIQFSGDANTHLYNDAGILTTQGSTSGDIFIVYQLNSLPANDTWFFMERDLYAGSHYFGFGMWGGTNWGKVTGRFGGGEDFMICGGPTTDFDPYYMNVTATNFYYPPFPPYRLYNGITYNGQLYSAMLGGLQGKWFGDIPYGYDGYSSIGGSPIASAPYSEENLDAYVAEIIIYQQPLSSGEYQGVANYLYTKYNLGTGGYSSASSKLYDVNIWASGTNTWDNHQTGLPNVTTANYYPTDLKYRWSSSWGTDSVWIGSASGIAIDPDDGAADDHYITHNFPGIQSFYWDNSEPMYAGGLTLVFADLDGLDPVTKITRARMNLRISLPPSGEYENIRDALEINGYNSRYKNEDYVADLDYINVSYTPLASKYGYYLYGAGDIIEQSGFKTYNTELNFLDPFQPSGNLTSIKHANAAMLANMEFWLLGVPSGAQISAAELQIEYVPQNSMDLYIAGDVERCSTETEIDAGTLTSFSTGHGGWQHRGWKVDGPNVIEEDIFENFYTFSEWEWGATRTYPETARAHYFSGDLTDTVYADYVQNAPLGSTGASATVVTTVPQKREYYRNPISAADLTPAWWSETKDISNIKPHNYRYMVYHGDTLDYLDLDLDGVDENRLATADICQIFFEDRLTLTEDFTLYFSIYRDHGFQSYGRFFHRGLTTNDGIDSWEIIGDLEPNLVRFGVMGAYGDAYKIEVDINQYTKEPILIWFSCGYNLSGAGETIMILNVHDDVNNYFVKDWNRSIRTFSGHRKTYSAESVRTVLGTLETLTFEEQLNRRLYLHRASPVEFGYANEYISLNFQTGSSPTTQVGYDTSQDKDKRFLSTRVANSLYLQDNPSGIKWNVPYGSGVAEWSTSYNLYEWTEEEGKHSIFNPITTMGIDNIVAPSAIYASLDVAHSTDHPSGVTIFVDVGFDSSTIDNWKVGHIEFTIPSGGGLWESYAPITYNEGLSKHIGMGDGPIELSDVDNISVIVTTKYHHLNEDNYAGNLELRSLMVGFDSFCTSFYDYITSSSGIDLYTYGIPNFIPSSGVDGWPSGLPLYVNSELGPIGDPNITSAILFIEGHGGYSSGNIPFYMWASPVGSSAISDSMTLFTYSNLDPQYVLPLYTTAGVGSINTNINLVVANYLDSVDNLPSGLSLFIEGPTQSTDSISLYVNTQPGTEGAFVKNEDMNLFMARDSESMATWLALYIEQNNVTENLDLFTAGISVSSSSVPLYIHNSGTNFYGYDGSGDSDGTTSPKIRLYTHGF